MVFDNWGNGQPNNDLRGNDLELSDDQELLEKDAVVISSVGLTAFWYDYPIDDQFEFVCLHTDYIAAPGFS